MDDVTMYVKEQWQEILGVSSVSGDSNFFEQGGDSVMVLALIERLESRWSVQLPLEDFFAEPTVSTAAQMVREARV